MALHAVYQGVIIYAGFETILISGVLRRDAGITGNTYTSAPSDSRALGAWLGVWSWIVGLRVHGSPSLQHGNSKKTTCCVSQPWPTNQFYVKALTKLKFFSPQIIQKKDVFWVFFFVKSGACGNDYYKHVFNGNFWMDCETFRNIFHLKQLKKEIKALLLRCWMPV